MRTWRLLFGLAVLADLFASLRPLPSLPLPAGSDLVAHALVNGALTLLAHKAFASNRAFRSALVGIAALGGAIEILQGFAPGRQPSLEDFGANLAGVALAGFALSALRRRARPPSID
jgi:VanZ family protein